MPRELTTVELQRQRRVYAIVVGVALAVGIGFVATSPDRDDSTVTVAAAVASTAPRDTTRTTTSAPTTTTNAKVGATTTTVAPTTTTQDPGALPQTDTKPTASGPTFDSGTQALWQAIVHDDPSLAAPFFFPKAAYLQVKAISDPAGDYQSRLLANYADDIHRLHDQLGADASSATFAGLSVPNEQAVWVQPGAEYNKGSYWRVYGSTLRYTVRGETRTFPVTSLISWRGEWYVVHLGVVR
ncbi:MAG: hypothetical protein ABWY77_07140 [Acidimicrobiia bacterium]